MAKFQVGRLLLTKCAHELFMKDANFNKFVNRSLGRYVNGDWGGDTERRPRAERRGG